MLGLLAPVLPCLSVPVRAPCECLWPVQIIPVLCPLSERVVLCLALWMSRQALLRRCVRTEIRSGLEQLCRERKAHGGKIRHADEPAVTLSVMG